jgi:CDP-diacylglycerol---glycerol-3-phosphate 3-phosphatidyltransferase
LSDFIDGYIARKFNSESIYGKYLDPVCDKIFTIVGILLISYYYNYPIQILYLIVVREFLGVIIGTFLFFKRGFQGEPNYFGKLGVVLVNINIAFYILAKAINLNQDSFLFLFPAELLVFIYLVGMLAYLNSYYADFVEFARRGT